VGLSRAKADAHLLSMRLHIQYLLALEDSPRVRAACLQYVHDSLVYFYPEWPDIVRQLEEVAHQLGGELKPPRLSPKYAWIRSLFGWTAAKRTQLYYNHFKSLLLSSWDRALLRLNL